MNKGAVFSLAIITFIAGIAVGFWLTPEYAMANQDRQVMRELGAADRWVDLRYVDGMIAHHQAAIYLLEQGHARSKRPEIQALAVAVIENDKKSIQKLYDYKQQWFKNTRAVTQFNQINLGEADDKFDLRLLNALVMMQEEAMETAIEISTKTTRTEVLNLADETIQSSTANAEQLRQWRKEWYELE